MSEEEHLRVFKEKTEYHYSLGKIDVYDEGVSSPSAKLRSKKIKSEFENGFLENVIEKLISSEVTPNHERISSKTRDSLLTLVESVTSETGRAYLD